jgi:hypothetical protein
LPLTLFAAAILLPSCSCCCNPPAAAAAVIRGNKYDLDKVPGPWKKALPLVGNVLDCLRPDFHRVLLKWADEYGGIYRMKFLWHDTLIVTGARGQQQLQQRAG